MNSKKAKLSIFFLLALFTGGIYAIWHFQFNSKDLTHKKQSDSSSQSSTSISGLSVQQSSNPLDLGQNPLGNNSGTNLAETKPSQPSGLDPSSFGQYEKYKSSTSALFAEIVKGDGSEVTANKKVAIIYRGWLTTGEIFDESKKDKDGKYIASEFEYANSNIITGLQQGMAGMKQGGSRLIIVPPSVGYGDKQKDNIPPNSILIFEVAVVKTD